MRSKLLLFLAVTTTCISQPSPDFLQEKELIGQLSDFVVKIKSIVRPNYPADPYEQIKLMLNESGTLSKVVIEKVLATLKCANQYSVPYKNILTIIDYSIPSSKKRLWIFDLNDKKLLFHTYVSHGIKSGSLLTNYFSNRYNSKSSSIGVYRTEKAYYGREGLSLRLDGLDSGFNDNASGRSIVMHGGWYMDENFIKRYGRPGRSWGCPAVPLNLKEAIINTIKDESLFVVYYPSDNWFLKSRFLNCSNLAALPNPGKLSGEIKLEEEIRDPILFADLNKNSSRQESEPVVVVSADNYEQKFHTKAPLSRMLRRQINHAEYIVLTKQEFQNIASTPDERYGLNMVYFVIPVLKMVRGYYETEMRIVDFGKITGVKLNSGLANSGAANSYSVYFDKKPYVDLKSTNEFIRWLGL